MTSDNVHSKANALATKAVMCTHAGVYGLVEPVLRENELLRDALEAIQWQAELGFWEEGGCSECYAHDEKEGHSEDCIVGKALRTKYE